MSLFGQKFAATGASNLFTGTGTGNSTGTGNTGGSSLFGAPTQQNQQAQNASPFGSSTQPQQTLGAGLFGSTTNQQTNQQPAGGSLFGSTLNNNNNNNNQQQQQQQQQGGLFGASQNNNANNNQTQGGGLFGNNQQQQQNNTLQQSTGLFGASQQPQQQQQQQPLNGSLWQPGSVGAAYEKTIPQQMQTVLEKWAPQSQNCLFQRYLYNNVPESTVIYHRPSEGDDEQKWEEALANKPDKTSIPVLCKGFQALGERLVIQAKATQALQQRLHEIFQSITAINQAHEIDISVRAADAKRKHAALSQRCLRLATKVQVLRNRGYVMDAAEEELRKKLDELERKTFDPSLSGRQEEIWARLVNVRERARFLQEEIEKNGPSNQQPEDVFDEAIVKRTKEVLNDYDKHITHLRREIEEISKDYKEWESSGTTPR